MKNFLHCEFCGAKNHKNDLACHCCGAPVGIMEEETPTVINPNTITDFDWYNRPYSTKEWNYNPDVWTFGTRTISSGTTKGYYTVVTSNTTVPCTLTL